MLDTSSSPGAGDASAHERTEVVRRFFDKVLAARDASAWDAFVVPDGRLHIAGYREPIVGLQAMERWHRAYLAGFPDVRYEIEAIVVEGDHAAVRWTSHQTHLGTYLGIPPTGRRASSTALQMFRFEGLRFAETWVAFDPLAILQQLRIIPEGQLPAPVARLLVAVSRLRRGDGLDAPFARGGLGDPRPPLVDRVLDGYGGDARWRAARRVESTLSCDGLVFRWKLGHGFPRLRFEADVHEPRARLTPIDAAGNTGVLEGPDVRLESPAGRVLAIRRDARRQFPYGRRTFRWDAMDVTFFWAYAVWNALVLPALLLRDDVRWRQVSASTLEGRFPAGLPTQSPVQRFHFDPRTGLLRRHDYTALVFGGWAHAGGVVVGHRPGPDGVPYTTGRRVYPRLPNGSLVRPIRLVVVDFLDVRIT